MATDSEAFVQLAQDGSGKKVRAMAVTVLQPDGTYATVEMQVVRIANDVGAVLDLDMADAVSELRTIRALLEKMLFTRGGF